ncbi:hypothetical protein [Candidatus Phytoplasma prunorum]|uniref:hypothetical protein n=1 Tax=Candidatus Phytoplasma prunorum TaxID=47565 RepID=UPI002FF09532
MKENFVILKTNWVKSIKEGKVDFEGYFSKVLKENDLKPYLKPQYNLGLLENFSQDEHGKLYDITGYDNFYKLNNIKSRQWRFKLRNNLQFTNRTEINNSVVKYSL